MQDTLKRYKKILNLENWDIQLIEKESTDTDGKATMLYDNYKAIIEVRKELSKESKKQTLIHEMIHLIKRDETDIALDTIENEYTKTLYLRHQERSTEQLAQIIYSLIGGI